MEIYLFDLDGTLSDSAEAISESLNHALDRFGLDPVEHSSMRRFVGPPLQDSIHGLLAERDLDSRLVAPIIESYREVYGPLSIAKAALYPGVPAMLAEVAARATIGVVTSKPLQYAVPLLDELDITDIMSVICGPGDNETEPKAETLSRALCTLSSSPEQATMVGDRRHDIEAGLAVGTFTIGVTWGFGDREELAAAGAHQIADRPDQVGP